MDPYFTPWKIAVTDSYVNALLKTENLGARPKPVRRHALARGPLRGDPGGKPGTPAGSAVAFAGMPQHQHFRSCADFGQ